MGNSIKTVLKLLLGVGSKDESFDPTPLNLLLTAFALLGAFFGSIVFIIYCVSIILSN